MPATCVPPEDESLYAKHSQQPPDGIALTDFGTSFTEDYKIQNDQQAGPSNKDNIGQLLEVVHLKLLSRMFQVSRISIKK